MNARETAWRVFATELNSSRVEIKATEEKMPSYLVTPLGAKINRVLIAGVMTEKENVGSEEEPMWKARIQDVSGSFFVNVGKFQPDASASMADIEVPCFVAAIGRVRTYTTDDDRVFVSVRPEHIMQIEESVRKDWVLETAKCTWHRLKNMKKALGMGDADENAMIKEGMTPIEAFGIKYALDNYGEMPNSAMYLKTIQAALRTLMPGKDIDLGFPEDMSGDPDEIEIDSENVGGGAQGNAAGANAQNTTAGDLEETILNLLAELDIDGKGAPREELEKRAEAAGIGSIELEEITNILMDKGLAYEPNLRYLKLI